MQFKNGFKKVTAVVLSTAMVFGSAITALAADPSTTAGTGHVLDYEIVEDVVPTAIKVAINPHGYAVNVRYAKLASDADFEASTKYYEKQDNGSYAIKAVTSDTFSGLKDSLYTATTSTDQLVTFNYGVANKSSLGRKYTVKFNVAADSKVEFVDSAAKATNQSGASDETGAKPGEYKIFMQLVPAKAGEAITTNTFAKASGDLDNTKTYYTKNNDGTYSKVETPQASNIDTYYVETTTIGTEIMSSELADVTMDDSTAPMTFTAGTGTTSARVAYSLPKATYNLKKDAFIDFDTETTDVASKFEMTGIGGLSGFTFTGTMNTNTKWAELTTKTITITPVYKFEDSTGLETAVSTGLNQVEPDADSFTVTYNANYGETPATATETVTAGQHPAGTGETVVALKTRDGYTFKFWGATNNATEAADLDTISDTATLYAIWEEVAQVVSITGTYVSDTALYELMLPENVTVNAVEDISDMEINGETFVGTLAINGGKTKIRVSRNDVKSTVGDAWATTDKFTFTFTLDGVNYSAADVSKN